MSKIVLGATTGAVSILSDGLHVDLDVWVDGQKLREGAHATSHKVKDRLMDRSPSSSIW